MREIKFRGMRVDNREWIYGCVEFHLIDGELTKTEKRVFITFDSMDSMGKVYRHTYEVIPETIGQFTGLHDKNGVEIYEGDLIEVKTDKHHFISEITWDDKAGCFEFQDTQNSYCGLDAINIFENGKSLYGGFVEVIGNIHERSE